MQIPGLTPAYTKHPIFPDLFSAMLVAAIIAIGMNFAVSMLRKKTTDIEKMQKIAKESSEFGKSYREAIKKQDKVRINELKKQQAYYTKMSLEMQQQQMRPMMLYMIPSLLLWTLVFPQIFGATSALSPIHIPYITCSDENVTIDTQLDDNGQRKGACDVPGEVFLWGWFLITSFATTGIITRITKTGLPSMSLS
ncbi:MAG: hypothetical protein DA328_08015 [Nitrososphaeraceae archaeon]|nr:hypothetical protein [Nitrososphaeraceae archaeon]